MLGCVLGEQGEVVTFTEWLEAGRKAGFCSDVGCLTHDLLMTKEEIEQFDDGWDPCTWGVRVHDPDQAK